MANVSQEISMHKDDLSVRSAIAVVSVTHKRVDGSSSDHVYELTLTIKNDGTERLTGYHVDLEMPAIVVKDAAKLPAHVPHRSSMRVAFFRYAHMGVGDDVFPGDVRDMLKIRYSVNYEIIDAYRSGNKSPGNGVKLALYLPNLPPASEEWSFDHFHNF